MEKESISIVPGQPGDGAEPEVAFSVLQNAGDAGDGRSADFGKQALEADVLSLG